MLFPVDIVCLDRDHRIVRMIPGVRPWRVIAGGRRTESVLELPAGTARRRGFEIGHRVEYVEKKR